MVVLAQLEAVLVGTWWYWVSRRRYWLVLGQYRSILIDTWWYWVNMERYWLIHDGTWSVEGSTGW